MQTVNIDRSVVIGTIGLTFGSVAKVYSDGDVFFEFDNLAPYFVLTKEDQEAILKKSNPAIPTPSPLNLPTSISPTGTSLTDDEFIESSIRNNGIKANPIYSKIFTIMAKCNDAVSAKNICEMSHIGVSKTTVAEKLVIMERCGLVKRTKSGPGITTLWVISGR